MKNKICSRLIAGLLVIALTGCGGRDPEPVLINQAGDNQLNCEPMVIEKQQNQTQIEELKKEVTTVFITNFGVGFVVGAIIGHLSWPALFGFVALDFKTHLAIKDETAALNQRNSNLDRLLTNKNCPL